jgi:nitroreductase
MLRQNSVYQAIVARRSVRRYEGTPLDPATLTLVREIIAGVKPLVPENHFDVLMKDVAPGEDLVSRLGGYGRLVTPPHYLVPYIVGERHPLTDLGHRVEQIAVRLAMLGIGTCYIGSLGREAAVRERFALPEGARIGAFLLFGRPSTALGGRTFNAAMRRMIGATNKLPAERIFFRETFDAPTTPPPDLAPLIEAARNAPSAVNAQPWRLLWRDGQLYLFVTRRNRRYGEAGGQLYRLYDGGICMGNVTLALEALGIAGHWVLPEGDGAEPDIPPHPVDLEPLARLILVAGEG